MLHKAWNSKVEMPYRFPRSSIKFQGHTVQNITDFYPNWAFPDYRPVAAFKSLRFALLCWKQFWWDYVYILFVCQASGYKGLLRWWELSARLNSKSVSFHNSHIRHSRAGRALLRWRKECGRLWVLLGSAVQAGPHTLCGMCIDSHLFISTKDIKLCNNLYLSFYRRW